MPQFIENCEKVTKEAGKKPEKEHENLPEHFVTHFSQYMYWTTIKKTEHI